MELTATTSDTVTTTKMVDGTGKLVGYLREHDGGHSGWTATHYRPAGPAGYSPCCNIPFTAHTAGNALGWLGDAEAMHGKPVPAEAARV